MTIRDFGQNRPHLLHIFGSFDIGGAQSRLIQLLQAFGDRYRHTIVALDGRYDMAARLPPGVPVQCRDSKIAKKGGWRKIGEIRGFIAGVNPDVMITYNWGTIEWAFANRLFPLARHVHIEDGFGTEERDRQLARRVLFRRFALSGRHTIVVLPSRTLLKIATLQWRLRKSSLRFITNGIDCERFAASRAPLPPAEPLLVGTAASLRPEKNIGRLIRAFAAAGRELPLLRLVIVGDGRERAALEQEAKAAGIADRVRFAGATDTPEHYFAEMRIFAMSSDTEQMPLVVLEAMASGLPVVSTDVGDIAEMIAAENRPFITGSADEEGLRHSLVALMGDAPLRETLGRLNREKALREFDYRQMAAKYMELFD